MAQGPGSRDKGLTILCQFSPSIHTATEFPAPPGGPMLAHAHRVYLGCHGERYLECELSLPPLAMRARL